MLIIALLIMSIIVLILLPFCFSEMAKPLHSPLANAERYINNTVAILLKRNGKAAAFAFGECRALHY